MLQGAEEGAEPWPGAAAWGRSGGKLGDRSAAVIRQGEGGRGWKLRGVFGELRGCRAPRGAGWLRLQAQAALWGSGCGL